MAAHPCDPTLDVLAAPELAEVDDSDGNLVTDGVIDPAKVVPSALENADARCGLMLTTESLVADPHAGHGHGGGY